jgi:DNA-nicking Smr family endonuclease
MKYQNSSDTRHRPFADLKRIMESHSVPMAPDPVENLNRFKQDDFESDEDLFKAAMADVKPIHRENLAELECRCSQKQSSLPKSSDTTLLALKELVRYGKGFVVEHTPEYMEGGSFYQVSREINRRLHRGDFSIQDYIDLHGMTVPAAQEAFETFMKEAVMKGRSGVLIVHGRGLSSPDEPVLKTRVFEWLSTGYWKKWVLAFTSARSCDGGAGATYVLLRNNPLTKRRSKILKNRPNPTLR